MILKRLFGRFRNDKVRAHELYVALVGQARTRVLYSDHGVPDTLDGRFDMIALHIFLVMNRLRAEQSADAAKAEQNIEIQTKLQETLFSDMDQALRERGVGDMGVGKRIREMAQAFFGRVKAYDEALALEATEGLDASDAALMAALSRNLFRGMTPVDEHLVWLAAYVRRQRKHLADQNLDDLMDGRITFA